MARATTHPRKRTFTRAEAVIEHISVRIMEDGRSYSKIAETCHLSGATVGNLARRKTVWPRPNTFFAMLNYFDIQLTLED